jgi:hypothetical protein
VTAELKQAPTRQNPLRVGVGTVEVEGSWIASGARGKHDVRVESVVLDAVGVVAGGVESRHTRSIVEEARGKGTPGSCHVQ